MLKKRSAVLAAVVAGFIAMMMLAAGGAGAQNVAQVGDNTDPQTTNVPYLAWAGEQIRLVKCFAADVMEGHPLPSLVAQASVVAWSGDLGPNTTPRPEVETNTASLVADLVGGRVCARVDVTSQYAGLAQIKLVVTDGAGFIVQPKHDFLAIWMNITQPTLAEAPGGGDNGSSHFDLGIPAQRAPGLIDVRIKGTFPWNGATWTLPDQWGQLALLAAVDADNQANPGPNQGGTLNPATGPAARWDIHDDQAATEGHPAVVGCTTGTTTATIEAVDNCNGGGPYAMVFSRYFGLNTNTGARLGDTFGNGIGPFDPVDNSTLLSDGKVDAGDAPMPAAPIFLTLSGDVGALGGWDKAVQYSRDGLGTVKAHNFYAPYYAAWIPATGKSDTASGVDGPPAGNNFPGFLNAQGEPYAYWTAIDQVTRSGLNNCNDPLGNRVETPSGASQIVVYTDEHGQAMASFDPTAGFNLVLGANNLCAAFTAPATFTATISAEAKYPFQPVLGQPRLTSNPATLTKTVSTAASKTLSCVPKGLNAAFCVETIRDLFGRVIPGAVVKFTANSIANANIQADATAFGGFDTNGQQSVGAESEDVVFVATNSLGQAGVLLTDSIASDCVNLRAENVGTRWNGNPGISVFTDFNPATGVACAAGPQGVSTTTNPPQAGGGSPPPTGGTAGGNTQSSNNQSSTSNSGGTQGAATTQNQPAPQAATALPGTKAPVINVSAPKKATVTISVAKFLTVGHSRFLGINLKSTAKTAKVNITLVGKNGAVIGHVIKTVKTNTLVKVLKLNASVKTVRVSALSL